MIIVHQTAARQQHAVVLLIQSGTVGHFIPVVNQSRLVNSKANQKRGKMCTVCLRRMSNAEFTKHERYCGTGAAIPTFPKEICEFDGHRKTIPCPVVIYADTEAIIDKETGKHIPICVLYVKWSDAPTKNL